MHGVTYYVYLGIRKTNYPIIQLFVILARLILLKWDNMFSIFYIGCGFLRSLLFTCCYNTYNPGWNDLYHLYYNIIGNENAFLTVLVLHIIVWKCRIKSTLFHLELLLDTNIHSTLAKMVHKTAYEICIVAAIYCCNRPSFLPVFSLEPYTIQGSYFSTWAANKQTARESQI